MVQLGLFSRGDAIQARFLDVVDTKPRFKKDKDKKFVLNDKGEKVIANQTVRLIPRNSEDGPSLASVTGLKGQGLMAFEAEARTELLKSASSHMMKLIASGHYTFDLSRINPNNGKFMLQIKPSMGMAPVLSREELEKQAKELGYTLVPNEPEKPAKEGQEAQPPAPAKPNPSPAKNGEVEVVIDKAKKPLPRRNNAQTPMAPAAAKE